ncbi:Gfo/Idh/MocA family oxidoreductase [Alkalitalea saponilacus]|uniref:Oxidoreductase family, C-terminal alpha/beta domain n=1 Tax=Alkalitalea saponilacus TaxID=889453 RepID=A0A1T5BEF4_9BACT|nr:Gfo/Idh/MocA family oxidoreductase [Alkalitalea saponilacus]ASB49715.1 4,5-dihydroxyphthalate dehydrogenase [Alkalitalea saponilacus]SKB45223.1 Oxidoreductase family, C-terminal alpha/beta domain [Alkalitalea saponilacus]
MDRRKFLASTGLAAGSLLMNPVNSVAARRTPGKKRKMALVGTGIRGVNMFGRDLLRQYGEYVELVGLCDINPGRLRYADGYIGANCPTFTDLEEMIRKQKPEVIIVTSEDSSHHTVIIKAMEMGCDIITEKPLTIDEGKAQEILDAQKRTGREIIVTFNYRYPPYRAKMKQLINDGLIGDINTVEFHWNIDHSHLTRYMQRWHGYKDHGGTLWVHKSTHHFDMVNWFLDSEPKEVFAYASLDRYGKNGKFRGKNCRNCEYTAKCPYYWDINANAHLKALYADNEQYDGYIRDNCVFRESIDIYEHHNAVVKYMNGAVLNYSLTGDTDYEGYWIAFNGTKGRLEARIEGYPQKDYAEITFTPIDRYTDEKPKIFRVDYTRAGHWGGDVLMMDKLFKDPDMPDPLRQQATLRDGVMSILTGVAARQSVESGKTVQIQDLTTLKPKVKVV